MTIMHLVYPPRLCITIVFDFSWNDCNTQENWKQWLFKIQGGGGDDKVHYGLCESGELYWHYLQFLLGVGEKQTEEQI